MEEHIKYYDLDEIKATGYWVSMLYGEEGKRKTTTAVSMIKETGLLISSDDSWKVLKKTVHKDLLDKVKNLVIYDSVSQLKYIRYEGYDTVIFDTVSHMVEKYLDLLFDKADWGKKEGKPKYREFLVTDHEELKNVTTTAPIDYKVTRDVFRPAIDQIMGWPCHKVFTSQVKLPSDLSKDKTIRPAMPDATFKLISQFADIIAWIKPEGRGLSVNVDEASLSYIGKSRIEGIEKSMPLEKFVDTYRSKI